MRTVVGSSVMLIYLVGYLQGHGNVISPNVPVPNRPVLDEDCNKIASGIKTTYGQHPNWDTKAFATDFQKCEFRGSLNALFKAKNIGSPGPNYNSKPQKISELKTKDAVLWFDPIANVGFTVDHHGPCAIYINDKQVFHDDDCTATHRETPARLPVDLNKHCGKECTLEVFWSAFVFSGKVQYYQNSAKLIGSGEKSVDPQPSNPSVTKQQTQPPVPRPKVSPIKSTSAPVYPNTNRTETVC